MKFMDVILKIFLNSEHDISPNKKDVNKYTFQDYPETKRSQFWTTEKDGYA